MSIIAVFKVEQIKDAQDSEKFIIHMTEKIQPSRNFRISILWKSTITTTTGQCAKNIY